MTSPAKRRKTVAKALAECPVGRWIEFNEFSRFMRAAGHRFEVAHDPWQLYIGHREYGCLGYDGYGGWNVLQDRQMLCFLFEYAATLGIIDVAFISPRMARDDFRDMWGTDDLDFLSRYDGLCYFRLNPLGAFCLGSIDHYTPSQPEARVRLNVMSNLQIEVDGALSPEEELLLENYADRESGAMWRLSRERTLSTLEGGAAIAELRSFLEARDDQELPDPVSAFLVLTERNATALKPKCRTLLIECADIEVVDLLTTHERSKKLCLRAGERLLVVKENDEAAFRKVAHMLGYGIPRSEV
jgi:hypothetical protein